MTYPTYISLTDALFFNIFDNLPYKYVKDLVMMDEDKRDKTEFEVKIEDLPCEVNGYSRVHFTFYLEYMEKTFSTNILYKDSSVYAQSLIELKMEEEEEEKTEEEEEENPSEDEEEEEEKNLELKKIVI